MTLKVDGTNGVLQAYDVQTLTNTFTYTFASGTQTLVITPAGTLATGTVTMPASPVDGMVITITSTQPITALTVNANTGQTINNGGSLSLQAGGSLSYVYNLVNTKWQPFSAALPIGVGQTWQNVVGSRALGTTYTNSTGRPITVKASICNTAYGYYMVWTSVVSGVTAYNFTAYASSGLSYYIGDTFIVPAGATYSCNVTGGGVVLVGWAELR